MNSLRCRLPQSAQLLTVACALHLRFVVNDYQPERTPALYDYENLHNRNFYRKLPRLNHGLRNSLPNRWHG